MVVDVVDDARADSMENAVFHCLFMFDALSTPELCTERPDASTTQRLALGPANQINAPMKEEFDIKHLKYPTYRHTLAAAFLSGSFEGHV